MFAWGFEECSELGPQIVGSECFVCLQGKCSCVFEGCQMPRVGSFGGSLKFRVEGFGLRVRGAGALGGCHYITEGFRCLGFMRLQ